MIKKEEIFINKIFLYYRENGFPYFPTDKEYRTYEFNKLKQGVNNNLIIDGILLGK